MFGFSIGKTGKPFNSTNRDDIAVSSKFNLLKIKDSNVGKLIVPNSIPPFGSPNIPSIHVQHNLGYKPIVFEYYTKRPTYLVDLFAFGDTAANPTNDSTWYAQSFVPDASGIISSLNGIFPIYPTGFGLTAGITLELYSDNSNTPGTKIGDISSWTHNDIGFSQPIYWSPVDTLNVVSGTRYWFVAKQMYNGGAYSTNIVYKATSGYANGKLMRSTNSGSSWSNFGGDVEMGDITIINLSDPKRWTSAPSGGMGYNHLDNNSLEITFFALSPKDEVDYKYLISADPSKGDWF